MQNTIKTLKAFFEGENTHKNFSDALTTIVANQKKSATVKSTADKRFTQVSKAIKALAEEGVISPEIADKAISATKLWFGANDFDAEVKKFKKASASDFEAHELFSTSIATGDEEKTAPGAETSSTEGDSENKPSVKKDTSEKKTVAKKSDAKKPDAKKPATKKTTAKKTSSEKKTTTGFVASDFDKWCSSGKKQTETAKKPVTKKESSKSSKKKTEETAAPKKRMTKSAVVIAALVVAVIGMLVWNIVGTINFTADNSANQSTPTTYDTPKSSSVHYRCADGLYAQLSLVATEDLEITIPSLDGLEVMKATDINGMDTEYVMIYHNDSVLRISWPAGRSIAVGSALKDCSVTIKGGDAKLITPVTTFSFTPYAGY